MIFLNGPLLYLGLLRQLLPGKQKVPLLQKLTVAFERFKGHRPHLQVIGLAIRHV